MQPFCRWSLASGMSGYGDEHRGRIPATDTPMSKCHHDFCAPGIELELE